MARAEAGSQIHLPIPAAGQSDWVTLGFAVQINDLAQEHQLLYLMNNGGNTHQNLLRVTTTGALELSRTGTANVVAITPAGSVPAATWTYIEMQIRLHNSAGVVKLRVNNVELASVTNVDTQASGTLPNYDWLYLYGGAYSGQLHYFDDMYIKTGAGETFLGPISLGPEARWARQSARVAFPSAEQQPGTHRPAVAAGCLPQSAERRPSPPRLLLVAPRILGGRHGTPSRRHREPCPPPADGWRSQSQLVQHPCPVTTVDRRRCTARRGSRSGPAAAHRTRGPLLGWLRLHRRTSLGVE